MQWSDEDSLALTRAVMGLLDDWGLQAKEMLLVLDMPDSVKARSMGRYRDGSTPLPDDPRVMHRVAFLLRISEALRTYFPTNPQMRTRWMRQANRRLRKRAPVAVIAEGSEDGLMAVLAELDCTYAWDLTGSAAP